MIPEDIELGNEVEIINHSMAGLTGKVTRIEPNRSCATPYYVTLDDAVAYGYASFRGTWLASWQLRRRDIQILEEKQMNKSIVLDIKIDFTMGTMIHEAAEVAINLSNEYDCAVSFDFNGGKVAVNPKSKIQDVIDDYNKIMREPAKRSVSSRINNVQSKLACIANSGMWNYKSMDREKAIHVANECLTELDTVLGDLKNG